jgi:transposase-like protein
MDAMPKKYPPEFKADVARVARRGDLTLAEVAADFDISVESVRRWKRQAEIDDGVVDGLTTAEQSEIVQLRRDKRRLEQENEILRRATAYFAKDAAPK